MTRKQALYHCSHTLHVTLALQLTDWFLLPELSSLIVPYVELTLHSLTAFTMERIMQPLPFFFGCSIASMLGGRYAVCLVLFVQALLGTVTKWSTMEDDHVMGFENL